MLSTTLSTGTSRICTSVELGNGGGLLMKSEEDARLCSTKPSPFNFQAIHFPDVSPAMIPKCEQYLSTESTFAATSPPVEDVTHSEGAKRKFVEETDDYSVLGETNILPLSSETHVIVNKMLRNSPAPGERDASSTAPKSSPSSEYKRWLLPLRCRCDRAFEEIEQFLAHSRECSTMLASVINISHSNATCTIDNNQERKLRRIDGPCLPKAEHARSEDGSRSSAMDLTTRASEIHVKAPSTEGSPTLICPECKVSTTNHMQLLRHFETVHGVYGTFSCICGIGFEWLPAFLSHYLLCSMAASSKSDHEATFVRSRESTTGNGKMCLNGSRSPVNLDLTSGKLEYAPDSGSTRFHVERMMRESPSKHKSPTGVRTSDNNNSSSNNNSNNSSTCGMQNLMGRTANPRETFEIPTGLQLTDSFLLPTTELLRKVEVADSRTMWGTLPKSFDNGPGREQKLKGKAGESEERTAAANKTATGGLGGVSADGKTATLTVTDLSRPFKCCHCVKSFKSKALLDQHMHIHYPPKYTCRYCAKKYRWPPVFYHHQRTCKKRPPATTTCPSSVGGNSTEALRTSASSGLTVGSHLYAPSRESTQHGQPPNLRFQLPGFPVPTSPLGPHPSVSLPNPLLFCNPANPSHFLGFPGLAEIEKHKARPFFLPHPAVFGASHWDKVPAKPSQPSPVTPPAGSAPMSPKINHSTADELSPTERLLSVASAMVLQLPFPPPLGVNMDLFRLPIPPPPPPPPPPPSIPAPPPIFPFFSRLPSTEVRPQQPAAGPPQTSFEGNLVTTPTQDANGLGSLRSPAKPNSMVAPDQMGSPDGVAESKMQVSTRCTCGTEFDSLSNYLGHIGQCRLFGKLIPPPALPHIAQQQQSVKTALDGSTKGPQMPPPLPFALPPGNLDNAGKLFPFIGIDSLFPAMLQNSLKNLLPPPPTGAAGFTDPSVRNEESDSRQKSPTDAKPLTDEPPTSTLTNMIMTMNAFIQSQRHQLQKGLETDADVKAPNTSLAMPYSCSAANSVNPQVIEQQIAKPNSTFRASESLIPSISHEEQTRGDEEKRLIGICSQSTDRRVAEVRSQTSPPVSAGLIENDTSADQPLSQSAWLPQEQRHASSSSQTHLPDPTASLMMMTMANMFAKIATAAANAPPVSLSEKPPVSPTSSLPLLTPTQFCSQGDLGFRLLPKFDLSVCAGGDGADVFTAATTTNLCSKCGKEFSSRLSLKQHVEGKHSAEGKYQCPGCAKRYRWGASYYYHKKSCAAVRDSRSSVSSISPPPQPPQPQSSLLPSARTPSSSSSSARAALLESGFCMISPSGEDASDESSSSVTAASSELTCSNHGEFLEAGFERNFVPGQSTLRTTEEVQTLLLHSTKRLLGQEGGKMSRTEETTNALGTEKSDSLVSIRVATVSLFQDIVDEKLVNGA
ncbi:hypothetical protein SprV_0100419800 [Sparganum proliferum]